MTETPQAIIRIVPGGGARTPDQIRNQWIYLTRNGDVPLQRSARHLGVLLPEDQLEQIARSWMVEAASDKVLELTTHIIVSFPPGTEEAVAFATARAWAEEVFGSGRHGGTFDYLTACHTDRAHPHMHLVVNRRALEGHWLKISRRHAQLNYVMLRAALVEIALRHGIILEATSRIERGLVEPPITFAEYRRRQRKKETS